MAKCKLFTAILPDTPEARRLLELDAREGRDSKLGRLAKVHDDGPEEKDCAAWLSSNPGALVTVTVTPNSDDSSEEGLGAKLREAWEARKSDKEAAPVAGSSSKKSKGK